MNPVDLDLRASAVPPGLTVIEASAGTGKTYSISHLVPRLLLEGALPDLSKLLLVTFTKDAARELADRVRRVLARLAAPPDAEEAAGTAARDVAALRPLLADAAARRRLDRALLDLDLLAVSTIHAFCQRTLQQEGALCGLPVLPEVVNDDGPVLEPIVRARWVETLASDPVLAALSVAQGWSLKKALKFINTRRRCLRPEPEPATEPCASLLARLPALVERLREAGARDRAAELAAAAPKWKKGGPADPAAARAVVVELAAAAPEDVGFWSALALAAALPDLANRVGKANKAAAEALAADPWFRAAAELHALAARLEWAWWQRLADEALPVLAAHMARGRLITQDGLIGALYHALHRTDAAGAAQSERLARRLAARYHVALIDESQDTDPRQFAIFRRIFLDTEPRRSLLLVGDPKQAIYGFRGADLSTYLAARALAGREGRIYTLRRTHRAPAPLVGAVNTLFGRPGAFLNPGLGFAPAVSALAKDRRLLIDGRVASRLEVWIVPEEEKRGYSAQARRIAALSARVASTIVDLLARGRLESAGPGEAPESVPLSPRDCAVLVATNAQAAGMAEALQARGVPAVINSGADVFATEEAADLLLLLRAIIDPRRTARLRRALATRLIGLDAAGVAALDTEDTPGGGARLARWTERFGRWQAEWFRAGPAALFAALEEPADASDPEDRGVTHRLALAPLTGERRATNYRHLTDLLLEAARESAPRPEELTRWLGQQIARAEERSDAEERQLQLSSDRAAVQVVTMHKAKGLEYPLVFCPYLADPLRKPRGCEKIPGEPGDGDTPPPDTLINIDLLDAERKAAREAQLLGAQLEERLRLAYVALTRAQVRLWTCAYRPGAGDLGSPLDWLLRGEGELEAHAAYSDEWAKVAKEGGAARTEATLRELGARARDEAGDEPPVITFGPPPEASEARYREPARPERSAAPRDAAGETLSALPPPAVPRAWRVTSFSTLTREKHAHGAPDAAGPDEAARAELAQALVDPDAPAPVFLASPGGAATGTFVHDFIEEWDFSPLPEPGDPDSPLEERLATSSLPTPRDGQPAWEEALRELFATLRLIRLPGCGEAPLHELCPAAHGSEWHFHLPLAAGFSASALARCFAEHAAPEHRAYAPLLAALSDDEFEGLLQGFIDRLARSGDAWGVIDWKTNRLGSALADYGPAGLLRCAMDSHYLLQAHLYLVALRRHLRGVGRGDATPAGAWLVFLRAIAPGSTRGVLHIDPPAALLDALDALFAPASRP